MHSNLFRTTIIVIIFLQLELGCTSMKALMPSRQQRVSEIPRETFTKEATPRLNEKDYENMTLVRSRTLSVPNPAYTQVLRKGVLTVTSFSVLRDGGISEFDLDSSSDINDKNKIVEGSGPITPSRTFGGNYMWPNELTIYKSSKGEDIMIVPDGFLTPGQSNGGLFLVRNPSDPSSRPHRITAEKSGWFYHRAIHVRLPHGKEGILTARAKKEVTSAGQGELVWIPLPEDDKYALDFHTCEQNPDFMNYDLGGSSILPEFVLAEGPDVMFEAWDMNPADDSFQVVTVNFFDEKISIYSLQTTSEWPYAKVANTTFLDTVGRPYGVCLANFNSKSDSADTLAENADISSSYDVPLASRQMKGRFLVTSPANPVTPQDAVHSDNRTPTHILVSTHECSYDVLAGVSMIKDFVKGKFPMIKTGNDIYDGRQAVESGAFASESGGALFAFEIPLADSPRTVDAKTFVHQSSSWKRYTLFRGFKVRGFGGIVSPGAPGLPYVFRLPKKPNSSPLILLAGDCTGSAYVFTPTDKVSLGVSSEYSKSTVTGSPVTQLSESFTTNERLMNSLVVLALLPLLPVIMILLALRVLREEFPVGFISGWYLGSDFLGINRKSSMDSVINIWSPALKPGSLPLYKLAFEIECGSTVGSAAVAAASDESGDVDLYIPSYEFNEIHAFRLKT